MFHCCCCFFLEKIYPVVVVVEKAFVFIEIVGHDINIVST